MVCSLYCHHSVLGCGHDRAIFARPCAGQRGAAWPLYGGHDLPGVAVRFGPALFNVLAGATVATYLFVQPRYVLFTVYGVENQLNILITVLLGTAVVAVERIVAPGGGRERPAVSHCQERRSAQGRISGHAVARVAQSARAHSQRLYVLEAMEDRNPEVVAIGEIMHRQVEHLICLVDDLLDVSRMTRGMITLRRENIRLSDIMDSAREIAAPLIAEKSQELTVSTAIGTNFHPGRSRAVDASPGQPVE